jgi:CheY-like chemotaxis protein
LARWNEPANFTVLDTLGVATKAVKPANPFAFDPRLQQADKMTQALALVFYEKLLPGSQLVNGLQDLNYRVQTLADASQLVVLAEQTKPLLVLVDLETSYNEVCAGIAALKASPATKHLPIIGFGAGNAPDRQAAAQAAGATLVVSETALLDHLPQILDQALVVE